MTTWTTCSRCSQTAKICGGTPIPSTGKEPALGSSDSSIGTETTGSDSGIVEDLHTGGFPGTAGPTIQVVEGVRDVEIGWHTRPGRMGEGIAPEAAAAARDWAFATLGVDRVISLVRPENEPSRRVAEKLGMPIDREVDHGGFRHLVYRIDRLGGSGAAGPTGS